MKSSELIEILKNSDIKSAEDILKFVKEVESPEIDKVLELVKIVESHDIGEIELSKWGSSIRVSKSSAGAVVQPVAAPLAAVAPQIPVVKNEPAAPVQPAVADSGVEIKSPMVGTFYQAPSPDAEPYVKVGDHISAGQPLCIIEAMKIMNVIEAEISGKIVKKLIENGQPVEYDQPIFQIEQD